MKMENRCLYCYDPTQGGNDFHKKCSLEIFGTPTPPTIEYSLDEMDELAKNVVERSVAVPGVQPKLSMSLVAASTHQADSRLTIVGALGGHYIFKPPSDRFPEMPENEHLTMRMAEAFGIPTVPSSLIRLASGERSYLTKRIDRTEAGEKVHMLDMFQITEAADKYKSSMEKVGKALDAYSSNTLLDKTYFFDLAVFSFLVGNNDMHLKNFSMIETPSGWGLAPAYDLLNVAIVLPEDKEEVALTLAGKKNKLSREHFEQLGEGLDLTSKQIKGTFNRMLKNKQKASHWIDQSFLSEEMKAAYKDVLTERYKKLDL
jgi:serine/threonine-protein kinase HipA